MATGGYTAPIQELIDQLGRLPGIGPKSAQRIAFHLLKGSAEDVAELAGAIVEAKRKVRFCRRCCNLATSEECDICANPRRDATLLCVVEEPRDVLAFERTGEFSGRYHVLHGAMNPMEGVGPDQLRMAELLRRFESEPIAEVIVGTNPQSRGRGHRHVRGQHVAAPRCDRHPPGERPAGGGRPGIRRRVDPRPRPGRSAGHATPLKPPGRAAGTARCRQPSPGGGIRSRRRCAGCGARATLQPGEAAPRPSHRGRGRSCKPR